MTTPTDKPLTPRQAFIRQLEALPDAARKEAMRRIDELAPRSPEDDDDYHSISAEDFVEQEESIITELDDDGNERPLDGLSTAPTIAASDLGPDEPYRAPPKPAHESPFASGDKWIDNFAAPQNLLKMGYQRINSPQFLLYHDRYIYRPLDAQAAAEEADTLTSSGYGKALVGFAVTCQKLAIEAREHSIVEGDNGEDEVDEAAARDRFVQYVQAGYESLLGEAGSAFKPFDLAFQWLVKCDVRRVPLPSNRSKKKEDRDLGGRILDIEGPGAWRVYYRKRELTLVRIAAAIMWESLGPFCTLLQYPRD
jgi:hypothetical protein